jgi:hypothetical protein
MENLRLKIKTEFENKMEDQSSRIEQTEERMSKLKDETVIKGKTEELLNNSRHVKRKCKNSPTLSKDQTRESQALKKKKRCKRRECVIYSTK